ncbi:hypothetical protein EPUS_08274 [Endocarpon pusillum Z07020]|uniref:Uncharacterized protein n=1 Tax=Endocarpon pusillum (strain Z07020 / HMAS-L-300199) TaxID=1263415 RepID=U1HYQ6_ENDPU|nr:uncharacterized protein EPUS_08274 [Endocarpon pusillum Z07020]ERF76020.1 hypothetical protein EPUS_08274 [Endocarpon pusillum Z07020]
MVASVHLKHILNQRHIELNDVSHLVATPRLVQSLNNHVIGADTKRGELGMENKKLECQLGEAKVCLVHDHEAEGRRKAELEKVRADLAERKQCVDCWQRTAVAQLDKYAPGVIGQAREVTLTTLQAKVENAEAGMTELVNHNNSLDTHLGELEFELGVNERRLTWDESLKIGFYKHHCSTVEEIEENKSKTAMIKVFEARFSKELAKNPI